jgi:hypothetical protein
MRPAKKDLPSSDLEFTDDQAGILLEPEPIVEKIGKLPGQVFYR